MPVPKKKFDSSSKIFLYSLILIMEETLYQKIYDAAVEVHQSLGGPGLLESIYESALSYELSLQGISNQRQVAIPVMYKDICVRDPLYLDILVENKIIIEVKATGKDYPYYHAQLCSYLRLANIPFGLIVNFGKENIKEGVFRMNNHKFISNKNCQNKSSSRICPSTAFNP